MKASGAKVFLDEVKVYQVQETNITLGEETDNTAILTENLNKAANVTLERTLSASCWNTLCLPFDMSRTLLVNTFGSADGIEIRQCVDVSGNTISFNSQESVSAGTPFLVKPATDIVNPTFKAVTIKTATPSTVSKSGYGMAGTFDAKELATDGTNLFLGTDAKLYRPSAGKAQMKGLRAYFVVPGGGAGVRLQLDGATTALEPVRVEAARVCYNLHGQRVAQPGKGLYVVDGKKVMIK